MQIERVVVETLSPVRKRVQVEVPASEVQGELDRVDHLLATIACHSVVRAGDVLGRPEALALLNQLYGVDLSSHCPHGRPVLLRLPLGEIERRFGRA